MNALFGTFLSYKTDKPPIRFLNQTIVNRKS
jgi:hypothetical protein